MAGPAARIAALDGIRTIAVFAVIAFHVRVPGWGGGFAGVDLFFVLSGFLITGVLLSDVTAYGTVRLATFWNRRFRRLMPAFLLMIAVVLVWAATLALPVTRAGLRTDLTFSLLYLGNWHFIRSASYFQDTGAASPLQHVWSLAVEEQFYLAWPLVVLAIAVLLRRRNRPGEPAANNRVLISRVSVTVSGVAVLLAAGSVLLLGGLFDPAAPERAYMGTDSRAFEPLLGAVLAGALQFDRVRRLARRWSTPLGIIGLLGVVAGLLLLGDLDGGAAPAYFHGAAPAFAIACAALIAGVTAGQHTVLARVLAVGPISWLGRISYGIYLWHWPLRIWLLPDDGDFHPGLGALVAVLSVLLAAASYYLIETPIRSGRLSRWLTPPRTAAVAVTLIAAMLAGTAAVRMPATSGHRMVLIGDSVPKRLAPMAGKFISDNPAYSSWLIGDGAVGGCSAMPIVPRQPDGTPVSATDCPTALREEQGAAFESVKPDVVLWWSRSEEYDRLGPDGTLLTVDSPAFWAAQYQDLKAGVRDIRARTGAVVVLVETDRPGIGMDSRCTPSKCHWFLRRLIDDDWIRVRWNRLEHQVASEVPGVAVIPIDDVYCHDGDAEPLAAGPSTRPSPDRNAGAVPCDDRLPSGKPARPDGTHFAPEAGPLVTKALLDRTAAALQAADA